MNAKERAEKIVATINLQGCKPDTLISRIAAQIEEAEREAHCSCGNNAGRCNTCYASGFKAAREKAIEVYRKSGTSEEAEERLRRLEP